MLATAVNKHWHKSRSPFKTLEQTMTKFIVNLARHVIESKVETILQRIDYGGNVSAVARELGKARVQIRRWCKRCDLDPNEFRK